MQEKSELREEKTTLKSDIEILNAQCQDRVGSTMVPWIPHYAYPIPVVAITQAPIYGTQNPNLCSTFIPYSASVNPLTEQALIQHSSSSSCASNKQDSKSKSLDLNHSGHKDDVGLELELKIHASSSSSAQQVSDFFNSFSYKCMFL